MAVDFDSALASRLVAVAGIAGSVDAIEPLAGGVGSAVFGVRTDRADVVVKIYPDIIKRAMHVIAREDNDGAPIEFFVFDLQGTLVQNSKMKQRDHLKITGLARGKYIYRVFSGDTETASGEFEIR